MEHLFTIWVKEEAQPCTCAMHDHGCINKAIYLLHDVSDVNNKDSQYPVFHYRFM